MKELHAELSEVELSMLKGIFEAEGIRYFVRNDNFGSMMVGPSISLYNVKAVLVDESDYERAEELLADFLGSTRGEEERPPPPAREKRGIFRTIRVILEVLLFGWFVPGRGRKKNDDDITG